MTIRYRGSKRALLCDDCDEEFDRVDQDEFGEMIAAAKNDGWKIRPDGDGGWEHCCPDCR